jgi:hypothetical protein
MEPGERESSAAERIETAKCAVSGRALARASRLSVVMSEHDFKRPPSD